MRSIRLGQVLAVATMLSLILLIAGLFGLGVAIRHGVVVPPILEVRHTAIHLAAYSTHYPECPPYTQCPPESVAPPHAFYVVWSIAEPPIADQPYDRTTRRLLAVPLQR